MEQGSITNDPRDKADRSYDAFQPYHAILSQPTSESSSAQPTNTVNNIFPSTTGQSHLYRSFVGNHFQPQGNINIFTNSENPKDNPVDMKRLVTRALYFKEMQLRRQQIAERAGSPESIKRVWSTLFSNWLQGPLPLFWITGLPGSGKSTLMKHLSESQITRQLLNNGRSNWKIIHFFFDFRSGSSLANSIEGLIRSLFYQLVNQVPEITHAIFSNVGCSEDEWLAPQGRYQDFRNMLDDFCEAIQAKDLRVCAFVDGLDEFHGKPSDLLAVLDTLRNRTNLKLCLSSRPERPLKTHFSDFPHIIMQDHNEVSMRWYIDFTWEELGLNKYTLAIKELSHQIIRQARGRFLWARIVIDEISDGLCSQEHFDPLVKIQEMPTEVEDLYESTLERLPPRLRCEAAILLYMLINAGGQVELERLAAAYWILYELNCLEGLVMPKQFCGSFEEKVLGLIGGLVDVLSVHMPNCPYGFFPDEHTPSPSLCPSCAAAFTDEDKTRSPLDLNRHLQVRLSHETISSVFRKRTWLSRRLPPQLLECYPDHFWLRLYIAEINTWSLSFDDASSQVGKVMLNFADRFWHLRATRSNPVDDCLPVGGDIKYDFTDVLNKFTNWTNLLPWALINLLSELEQDSFSDSTEILSEALKTLASPLLLIHYVHCCMNGRYSTCCSVDFHSQRHKLQVGMESSQRAVVLCIAHDCDRALDTYLRNQNNGVGLEVQAVFDILFEKHLEVENMFKLGGINLHSVLGIFNSLSSRGAKLRSEQICFLLCRSGWETTVLSQKLLEIFSVDDFRLKLGNHHQQCNGLIYARQNFLRHVHQHTSFLLDWIERSTHHDEHGLAFAELSLKLLMKLGQNIDGPLDRNGCTLLEFLMSDPVGLFATAGSFRGSFACLIRAGADLSGLDKYLHPILNDTIKIQLTTQLRCFQSTNPTTLGENELMRWFDEWTAGRKSVGFSSLLVRHREMSQGNKQRLLY